MVTVQSLFIFRSKLSTVKERDTGSYEKQLSFSEKSMETITLLQDRRNSQMEQAGRGIGKKT